MLAGPYCGMLLADLGAEVIKIETGTGDISRATGRHYVGRHNVYFASLNRNKKSVTLDLTDASDRKRFEVLVRSSDALVTNLRPSAIKKLGLTYDQLAPINPKLVCLALTGYGLEGPRSDLPAYDYVIQALAGVMMLSGEPDAPPTRVGYSVVDNTGGMMGAIGVLAKLVEGQGGQIDLSLMDTMLSQMNYLASAWLNAGEVPQRHPGGGHSYFVPAQTFSTSDGYIAIFVTHDRFWEIFALELGRPDWLSDTRFATMAARSANRSLVVDDIQIELRRQTTQYWVDLLQPKGVVAAPVRDLVEALSDLTLPERKMLVDVEIPGGKLRLIGNPLHTPMDTMRPPPLLGEHNDAIGRSLVHE
jgi:crotonobetainyl-CoA:carnitine CoA-transferase CaiB-like acyl-CoA transferase